MSGSLFSSSWYRIAGLKPQIRSHTRFHRHHYRGQLWYVLQDRSSGRCHRLTPSAYQLVGLMDGERTSQEIWQLASERLGDDGPTQDETIRLLGLLHFADVLRCDVPPDTVELLRRQRRRSSPPQFTVTNILSARLLLKWIARAINSLPVPLSPVTRTVLSVSATLDTISSTPRSAALLPMMLSYPYFD